MNFWVKVKVRKSDFTDVPKLNIKKYRHVIYYLKALSLRIPNISSLFLWLDLFKSYCKKKLEKFRYAIYTKNSLFSNFYERIEITTWNFVRIYIFWCLFQWNKTDLIVFQKKNFFQIFLIFWFFIWKKFFSEVINQRCIYSYITFYNLSENIQYVFIALFLPKKKFLRKNL